MRGDSRASGHPSLTSAWTADKTTGTTPLAFEKRARVGRQTEQAPSIEHMSTLQIQPPFSWLQTKSIVKRESNQAPATKSFSRAFLTNRAGMTDRITRETNMLLSEEVLHGNASVQTEKCFSDWIVFWKTRRRLEMRFLLQSIDYFD